MSDSGNPSRGDEPADGESAAAGERGDAASPRWWTGSEAKREFQDPAGSEEPQRPANNWFGDGWTARRPEDPAKRPTPPAGRPAAGGQSTAGRTAAGPAQPSSGQSGPGRPAQDQPSSGQRGAAQP